MSFGVFQNYFSRLPEYANQPFVSVIGTVATGISYMGAAIIIPIVKRVPQHRSYITWTGCKKNFYTSVHVGPAVAFELPIHPSS